MAVGQLYPERLRLSRPVRNLTRDLEHRCAMASDGLHPPVLRAEPRTGTEPSSDGCAVHVLCGSCRRRRRLRSYHWPTTRRRGCHALAAPDAGAATSPGGGSASVSGSTLRPLRLVAHDPDLESRRWTVLAERNTRRRCDLHSSQSLRCSGATLLSGVKLGCRYVPPFGLPTGATGLRLHPAGRLGCQSRTTDW